MAKVAPALAKKAAGAAKVRKPAGPSVRELLLHGVVGSKECGGISLAVLKKSLAASGYDVEKNNSRLKLGVKNLVTKGTLLQIKGTGASGSFKLNKKQADPKDKAARKKPSGGAPKKAKKALVGAGSKKPAKKPVKKPTSVVAKKPNMTKPKKPKSPAKPLKAKAKTKPKASMKAKPTPKKK